MHVLLKLFIIVLGKYVSEIYCKRSVCNSVGQLNGVPLKKGSISALLEYEVEGKSIVWIPVDIDLRDPTEGENRASRVRYKYETGALRRPKVLPNKKGKGGDEDEDYDEEEERDPSEKSSAGKARERNNFIDKESKTYEDTEPAPNENYDSEDEDDEYIGIPLRQNQKTTSSRVKTSTSPKCVSLPNFRSNYIKTKKPRLTSAASITIKSTTKSTTPKALIKNVENVDVTTETEGNALFTELYCTEDPKILKDRTSTEEITTSITETTVTEESAKEYENSTQVYENSTKLYENSTKVHENVTKGIEPEKLDSSLTTVVATKQTKCVTVVDTTEQSVRASIEKKLSSITVKPQKLIVRIPSSFYKLPVLILKDPNSSDVTFSLIGNLKTIQSSNAGDRIIQAKKQDSIENGEQNKSKLAVFLTKHWPFGNLENNPMDYQLPRQVLQ